MKDYAYNLEMQVRDYECDIQQVVNNANYQHYLEHARHEFLASRGMTFRILNEQGVLPVVAHIELTYKQSLRASDKFIVGINIERKGIKAIFHQDIYRLPDHALCLTGKVTCVILAEGRITKGELFDTYFKDCYLP